MKAMEVYTEVTLFQSE